MFRKKGNQGFLGKALISFFFNYYSILVPLFLNGQDAK